MFPEKSYLQSRFKVEVKVIVMTDETLLTDKFPVFCLLKVGLLICFLIFLQYIRLDNDEEDTVLFNSTSGMLSVFVFCIILLLQEGRYIDEKGSIVS